MARVSETCEENTAAVVSAENVGGSASPLNIHVVAARGETVSAS
jgi:hypothetical protein